MGEVTIIHQCVSYKIHCEQLNPDTLEMDLGVLAHQVVSLPHCIFSMRGNIGILLDVAGTAGAIWGDALPYNDEDGNFYDDRYSLEDMFKLWKTPKNQDDITVDITRLGGITILVDAETPVGMLQPLGDFRNDKYAIAQVISNIVALRWALVPLTEEIHDFGILLASEEQRALVDEVTKSLKLKGACPCVLQINTSAHKNPFIASSNITVVEL